MFKDLTKKEIYNLIIRSVLANTFLLICMYSFLYFIAFTEIKYIIIGFMSMILGLLFIVGIE